MQRVSTREVRAITGESCGHEFRASRIRGITQRPEEQLEPFSRRVLRDGGVILNRAMVIALGIDWEGRRQVLAVEYPHRIGRLNVFA